MNWETLLCLGDSITIGSRSYLGYPEYCGDYLTKTTQKDWNVINHATAGFTTVDLVRQIDKNIAALRSFKPDFASVLIGTNDLKSSTSITDFKIAYQQLLVKVTLIVGSTNFVLVEIPKLLEGVMLPYRMEMNQLVEQYNAVIHQIALDKKIEVIRFTNDPSYFYDGVHLNGVGSSKWGAELGGYITNLRTNR